MENRNNQIKIITEGYQPKLETIERGLQPKATGRIGPPPKGGGSAKKPK